MFDAITINLVPGGFHFAIAGGFDIMISWLSCLIVYVGVHQGSKIMRLKRKKNGV